MPVTKIAIKKRTRNGNVSLWVDIPNVNEGHVLFNVWDLKPKEATDDVLAAIVHAFELGVLAQERISRKNVIHVSSKVESDE